jgi:hydroxyethylthiazole kinase-like uncharacterized protein yjeF
MNTLTLEYINSILPPRPDDSHKMTFGQVLNIAGSIHYRGAAYLSSLSALRVGAGYVTLASSPSVCDSVSAQTPNVVTLPLPPRQAQQAIDIKDINTQSIAPQAVLQLRDKLAQASVISIGSGLSISQSTDQLNRYPNPINGLIVPDGNSEFFYALLTEIQENTHPVIFDADALNFMSRLLHHPTSTAQKPITLTKNSIITPHPKELSRLLNVDVKMIQAQRVHFASLAAKQLNTLVVLKGKHTVISDGEHVFINPTGNSALAKAGTGDVLTGMIAGFCAQGVSPLNAACLGVYLHGLAGEFAANELSQYGVLASDLLEYIPKAILRVLNAGH